jgi:hypothetical protein
MLFAIPIFAAVFEFTALLLIAAAGCGAELDVAGSAGRVVPTPAGPCRAARYKIRYTTALPCANMHSLDAPQP